MLTWYRTRARAFAGLLLVAWVSLAGATAAPHHDDCHDAVCLTAAAVHHDPASHSIEGPPAADDHPLHCVVCHWIRAFKPHCHADAAPAPSLPDAVSAHAEPFAQSSTCQTAQPPLRAPPDAPQN